MYKIVPDINPQKYYMDILVEQLCRYDIANYITNNIKQFLIILLHFTLAIQLIAAAGLLLQMCSITIVKYLDRDIA